MCPITVSAQSGSKAAPSNLPAELQLPSGTGFISQTSDAVPSADHTSIRRLIIVQDAHVNYEAQKNLASILDHLAEQYQLRLVLVEGGSGDVDLSYMRKASTPKARAKVAEQFLEQGLIAGEEYADLVSDHDFLLWGIEDQALYDEQFELHMQIEALRETVGHQIQRLREHVEALKSVGLNETIRSIDRQDVAYHEGVITFQAYIDFLIQETHTLNLSLNEYPQIAAVQRSQTLSAGADLERVKDQQNEALARIQREHSEVDLAPLKATASRIKAGEADSSSFYTQLANVMAAAGFYSEDFPELFRYIRSIQIQDSMDVDRLLSEMRLLSDALKVEAVTGAQEKRLLEIDRSLDVVERLIALEWSAHHYDEIIEKGGSVHIGEWIQDLSLMADQIGVAMEWDGDVEAIDAALDRALHYYEVSVQRDDAMIAAALRKMDEENENLAVMVVGGFHTDHLCELSQRSGVPVVVITPQTGDTVDAGRYERVLKIKRGLIPYNEWGIET